jgi:3D-(3,5/4)-trihydroxycyclohexane-1,2-dione acylhydrolase (decyclizing)
VDFEAHARAMGAKAETVANPAELAEAFQRAKAATKTSVIVMQVDPYDGWTTQGHAWWEIGTAEVSDSADVRAKHVEVETGRGAQRRGV